MEFDLTTLQDMLSKLEQHHDDLYRQMLQDEGAIRTVQSMIAMLSEPPADTVSEPENE
jgi:hypothetical protein